MTKEEALSHYRKHFDMGNENEHARFVNTTDRLERATRASDIAAVVGMLYGVSGINSSVVKSGEFIESVVTIAENVKSGRSVNNVRDHIKNVIARGEWEKRDRLAMERREQEGRRFRITGNTVTVNFAVSMDMAMLETLKTIIHQFDVTLCEVDISRFDGDPVGARSHFQIGGTAGAVAAVLHRMDDELGPSSLSDICYMSHATGLERPRLTLRQAIMLADHEGSP